MILVVMGIVMVVEIGYIVFQVVQVELFYFNLLILFYVFMYLVVMFFGVLVFVIGIGIYGIVVVLDCNVWLILGL